MIQTLYQKRCNEPGNINEHLPAIYCFSLQSQGVAEFGVEGGISTSALIAGQDSPDHRGGRSYCGYDPDHKCRVVVRRLRAQCLNRWPIVLVQSSSITVNPIEPVDMLFIDSRHDADVIREELSRHLSAVRRFLCMHDTVTYGVQGETPGRLGILHGIEALQEGWRLLYDSPRCHGLRVYERESI